jgi:transcriptional regulator GlxA family with amidase domain
LLVGQMTRPTIARPTGVVDLIGIRLRSSRAGMALSTSMQQLNDRTLSLSEVWSHADRLVDELRETAADDRLALLAGALTRRASRVDGSRVRVVDHALALIERADGAIAIDAVARTAGVSRRQLERLFREHVGLSPKDVARIARVQAALRVATATPRLGGAEIAARCGFSDQAHLIHECRAIAGVTPARFSSSTTTLASLMRA